MDYYFYAFIVICVIGMKIMPKGNREYLSREHTQCVNGIFVMMVFLSHFKQYITCGPHDATAVMALTRVGQGMVTTFLFYSGYGMMVSLQTKEHYLARIPKRFFTLWLKLFTAVCCYLILDYLMAIRYDWKTILLSLTGYRSVGNSNWYMFAVFFLYIVTYLTECIAREKQYLAIALITLCCAVYIAALYRLGDGYWFYDTILCYPAGMVFALVHESIEKKLDFQLGKDLLVIMILGIAFLICYRFELQMDGWTQVILKEAKHVFFVLALIGITMHVKFGNRVLSWFGSYIFEIYILERMPMMFFQNRLGSNTFIYFGICLITTVVLAVIFKKMMNRILVFIR